MRAGEEREREGGVPELFEEDGSAVGGVLDMGSLCGTSWL